jgi:Tissue inhibitor of metalloproteinase
MVFMNVYKVMNRKVSISMLLILLISFLMLLIPATPTYACSCASLPPADENLARKTAVFAGKVVSIKNANFSIFKSSADPVQVTLEVSEVWKGPAQQKIVITTAESSASCGYNFDLNSEYLVYAHGENNQLSTGLCEGTKLLSSAASDLAILGTGKIPIQESKQDEQDNVLFWVVIAIVVMSLIGVWGWMRVKHKRSS